MAGFWKEFAGGFSNPKDDNGVGDEINDMSVETEVVNNQNKTATEEVNSTEESIENILNKTKNNVQFMVDSNVESAFKEIIKKNTESNKANFKIEEECNSDNLVTADDKKKGQVGEVMELNNRTIITKSTIIAGNISTEDDLIIEGSVCGDVDCKGKLTISGEVSGNAVAKAISINTSKFEGDVRSDGRIEIKEGTVIIGNIYGDEALISGAVKGEIVVANGARLEKSAIVKGNIKAKSVQIDNGAVLQGYCELQYDNLDLDELFGPEDLEEETVNTGGMTYQNMVANIEEDDEISLEEQYEKELEAQEAAQKQAAVMQENVPVKENTIQIQEISDDTDNEAPEEAREAYMQEMEDNYSNFMDQLQMDSES